MAISVVCDACGKRLNVRDELVGKKVKCPACKTPFTASPSGAIKVKKKEKGPQAKVSISWGFIGMIAGAVIVVGAILAIIFGPVRAKNQWDPMAEKAESDTRDVVERGLQFAVMQTGMWSPRDRGPAPTVHEVHMLWDMMVMGLPEHIRFKGTTTEGEYTGTYNTKTFEINAEVELGGIVVPGVGEAAKKGDKVVKVRGSMIDGNLQVTVNGKKAELYPSASTSTKPAGEKKKTADENLPVAPGL